jgi:hypothetical protein
VKRGSLVLAVISGCGAAVVPEAGDATTSTSSSSAGATTAMLEGTTSLDPSSSSGDSSSSSGYEMPKLDVAAPDVGPIIDTCASEGAALVDLTIVAPSGPFAATHAWWAWEACCINDPWLVLAATPELEVSDHTILAPHVMVHVPGTWESTEPYVGPRDVRIRDIDASSFTDPIAGLELAEPLDPEVAPDPAQHFVATFAIDGGGWTITGSVDAPYCAAIQNPACPCE